MKLTIMIDKLVFILDTRKVVGCVQLPNGQRTDLKTFLHHATAEEANAFFAALARKRGIGYKTVDKVAEIGGWQRGYWKTTPATPRTKKGETV